MRLCFLFLFIGYSFGSFANPIIYFWTHKGLDFGPEGNKCSRFLPCEAAEQFNCWKCLIDRPKAFFRVNRNITNQLRPKTIMFLVPPWANLISGYGFSGYDYQVNIYGQVSTPHFVSD